ncbi:MAG: hypothetical protein K2N13_02040 [Paraprevotella sp.]|nr:hypothetical protein [Paraprevotella sp.]
MKRILLMFVALAGLFSASANAVAKKVAVYVEGEVNKANKKVVTAAIMSRLSGNKEYAPFERIDAFVNALTKEQDYQLSGEVPESQIRAVGQRLGVDYVIAVDVTQNGDMIHMTARLIELETGAILKSVNAQRKYTDSSVYTVLGNNVSYRLLSKKSK